MVPELQLLRPDHASVVMAFELANRAFFATAISDHGDAYFEHFTEGLAGSDVPFGSKAQPINWAGRAEVRFHLVAVARLQASSVRLAAKDSGFRHLDLESDSGFRRLTQDCETAIVLAERAVIPVS